MAIKRAGFILTNDNIDLISKMILDEMDSKHVAFEHRIKTRLSLEEALLRLQQHFGEKTPLTVSSFHRFGRQNIEVRLRGDAYNPLRFSESEFEEWDQMLSFADYQPDYQYTGHTNLIRWSAPLQKKHPAIISSVAIALGLLLGVIGSELSSNNQMLLAALIGLLEPVEEVWIRLLNVLCGPITFLLLITTVLNMDSITRQGDNTNRFFIRVFRMSLLSSLFATFACIILFPDITLNGSGNIASDFKFLLLELVPEDIVSPFASSNVPQLLLLGVVIGSALIASGKKYPQITGLIHEANGLGLRITEGMSSTAPFFLCVLIAYEIISDTTVILKSLWIPVLLFIVIAFMTMLLHSLYTAIFKGFRLNTLMRALYGPFIRTIKSGSADTVLKYTLRNCHDKLGIDRRYAEVGLRIGLVMYMPISASGTLIFVIYTASMYKINADFMWYVMAVVVAVAMSVAVPPVPGVGILTYVVMFAQLGLPSNALIAAMVFDVLTSLIITAVNQYMLQLELILSADRMAMLDHSVLNNAPQA